jgi:precorrin-6B methylase 2
MAIDHVMKLCRDLARHADTLAALGAALRIKHEGLAAEPSVNALLGAISHNVSPNIQSELQPAEMAVAVAWIRTLLRQSLDLFENPDRPSGWTYDDPLVLDSQGRASRFAVYQIEAFARQRPTLAATLANGGAFLDIGTGTGWIAIEAVKRWPGFTATGIDPWEPSLTLARRNVKDAGVDTLVTLLALSAQDLETRAAYKLVWLPAPFIQEPAARAALPRIAEALIPGGTLVVATLSPAASTLDDLLSKVHTIRGGGHPWTADGILELLETNGFVEIGLFSAGPLILVAGRRPGT